MSPTSVDDYLSRLPQEQRAALIALREQIRRAAPGATECISYGLPAFRRNRVLCGYGATARHCAFYAFSSSALAGFAAELAGFDVSKGTVRFQPERPLPAGLVKRLVEARLAEDASGTSPQR